MPKLTFYPLGNADCCRIDLANGKKILFDFADVRNPDDPEDHRCDLPKLLREDLQAAGRDGYDVVAFTHLDADHIKGSTRFFHLNCDPKYQSQGRIRIGVMWVPAAVITEDAAGMDDEAKLLQREARHRFREGEGIRVFSRPDRLKDWCSKNGVDFEKRKGLITDAGWPAPEFSKLSDGVEFFVHSPFAKRLDECEVEDRNRDSIVMQATFLVDNVETKALLMADVTYDMLADIVEITEGRGRGARLEWDIAKLPHHCSYLSLGPEKGEDRTEPVDQVKHLYEEKRLEGGVIVSTSEPIPAKGTAADKDTYPPHRQAANYYKAILDDPRNFLVTMEQPSVASPEPLVIEIDRSKATVRKRWAPAAVVATSRPAHRAGGKSQP